MDVGHKHSPGECNALGRAPTQGLFTSPSFTPHLQHIELISTSDSPHMNNQSVPIRIWRCSALLQACADHSHTDAATHHVLAYLAAPPL